ncbi:DUF2336 domain-containing protein [Alkalicaulis satelles]|uniref:DUF2336 domain-containing protein n=1 Tax=Alkalicaulis satelles TaxID=2609175 RepID=A0A5M6ZAJ0_9PROT|nr:DUF2336 domain-containing protein [Alkalicaulis satelles]KAA5801712.1 DUF2336 domain-containing protein [Alkalicaulis satelles]
MPVSSRLNKLADLAREKSSERRRALLREVTDLFFEEQPAPAGQVQAEFDAVLQALASQTANSARAELAERFADSALAPRGLILQLARDAIEVAGPILSRSKVLKDEDLITIVHERGQDHIRAVAGREGLGEKLSSAIVERGDDRAVKALVNNPGSRLNREAFEAVTRRAEASPDLQAPLVARADTPADLLNDLMLVVENHLRDKIMSRFDSLEPGVLEAALAASRQRLSSRMAEDKELAEARRFIAAKAMRKELDGGLLVRLLREKKRVHFAAGFAQMTGVDYTAARRALEHDSPDGLALICKAAGLDKALFVTVAVLRAGAGEHAFTDARDLGKAYDDLDAESAGRAMRFMKLRKDAQAA